MTRIIGRIGTSLASMAICGLAETSLADAAAWVRGMPGGPELTLSMTSMDEADGALRELARAAQIDWLPTAGRLLSVTNLSPGADTSRPISFGFVSGEEPRSVRFLAVIPSDRPAMIAANFDGVPSTRHAGLYEFGFAGRSYFARVLPDDHLAISDSASVLLGLREVEGDAQTSPMRVSLQGEASMRTLIDLMNGIQQRDPQAGNADGLSMPEDVESIMIDLIPSAGSLRADVRVRAAAGSELAGTWKPSEAVSLEPLPFPDTPELLIAQGSLSDPAVRQMLLPLCEGLLGVGAESLEQALTMSLLIEQPSNLMDFANLRATVSLLTEDAQQMHSVMQSAIASRSGARVLRNASTRNGVELDRFLFTAGDQTRRERSGPMQRWMPGSGPGANSQPVQGWMFAHRDRVYLTTVGEDNGLDRLIAFGPDMTSIGSRRSINDWLSQLPEEASGRASINIAVLARYVAMGMSMEMPENIEPFVGSLRSGESEVHATLIMPAPTLGLLDRFRLRASERRAAE